MGETERTDGYTDFIFINRFGGVQHQGTLNKAIRRITRECNEKQLNSNSKKVGFHRYNGRKPEGI